MAKTLRNLAAGGHSVLVASHDSRIVAAADRVIRFPFEEESNDAKTGKFAIIEKGEKRNPYIGHRMNLRTLSGLANNGIAGLLTLGAMLALLDPSQLEDRTLAGFILAPALAAGLCGKSSSQIGDGKSCLCLVEYQIGNTSACTSPFSHHLRWTNSTSIDNYDRVRLATNPCRSSSWSNNRIYCWPSKQRNLAIIETKCSNDSIVNTNSDSSLGTRC